MPASSSGGRFQAKFAALLVFGALLTPQLFRDLSLGGYVAVVLAIVLIRPASLLLSLIGTASTAGSGWSLRGSGPRALLRWSMAYWCSRWASRKEKLRTP